MSTYSSTQWTCDRCGFKEEAGARNATAGQPIGWASLYEVTPVLMNPGEWQYRPDQICQACRDSFHEWFMSPAADSGPVQ